MKCIFKLGFNIYNLFNRGSRNQSFSSFVLAIITISLLVLVPLYLIIKPEFFASQLMSLFSVVNSSYQFIFETIIMFGALIIYTLLFMLYGVSKIKHINSSSIKTIYIVDSITYISNINGRVKKFLLKIQDLEAFGKKELIVNLLPFRKLRVGKEVNVIYRDVSFQDLYYIEGDMKTIVAGYSLLTLIEIIVGLILGLIFFLI